MKKKSKGVVDSSEAHFESPKEWKFFVNDRQVSEEEYIRLMDEHMEWVKQQELLAAQAIENITPVRKRRKK